MSKSAFSLMAYSIYLFSSGAVLTSYPNFMLSLFNTAETNEVWIRVVGMTVMILAYLDLMAARSEIVAYFRWSVYARLSVPLFLTAFIVLGFTPATPILIVIGMVDLIAAIWTAVSLRKDRLA